MNCYMARLFWFEKVNQLYKKPDTINSDDYGLCIRAIRIPEEYKDWYDILKRRIDHLDLDWQFFDTDDDYLNWTNKMTEHNIYYTDDDGNTKIQMKNDGGVCIQLIDIDCDPGLHMDQWPQFLEELMLTASIYYDPKMADMPKELEYHSIDYHEWMKKNIELISSDITYILQKVFPEIYNHYSYSINQKLLVQLMHNGFSAEEILNISSQLNSFPIYYSHTTNEEWLELLRQYDILEPVMEKNDLVIFAIKEAYTLRQEALINHIQNLIDNNENTKDTIYNYLTEETRTNDILWFYYRMLKHHSRQTNNTPGIVILNELMPYYHDLKQQLHEKYINITDQIPKKHWEFFSTIVGESCIPLENFMRYIDDLEIFEETYRSQADIPIEDLFA